MFRWYVINTYSGHENKVKQNLEHRVHTMGQERNVRQVVVPTEQISEMKDGQKVQSEKRTMPGYVLVNMEMTDDAWGLVKNTPGVTGFVGSRNKPIPLSKVEVDRLLHRETAERPRTRAQFSIGESVKVISGFSSLRHIDLYHTLVSEQAIASLTKAMPNCTINWAKTSGKRERRT